MAFDADSVQKADTRSNARLKFHQCKRVIHPMGDRYYMHLPAINFFS
jgi:hypothetical protein